MLQLTTHLDWLGLADVCRLLATQQGLGVRDSARPQARTADTQLWRLHSGAARRAEPLPQGWPAAGSHRRLTGVRLPLPRPPCFSLPCGSISSSSLRQSWGDAEVIYAHPEKSFSEKKTAKLVSGSQCLARMGVLRLLAGVATKAKEGRGTIRL